MLLDKIGATIDNLSRGRGWILAELSTRTGIDPGSLSKMERGQKAIHDQHIELLATAFAVHPTRMLPDPLDAVERALLDAARRGDHDQALRALADLTGVPHPNVGERPTERTVSELADLGRASVAMTRASANLTGHIARLVAAEADADALIARWANDPEDSSP